MNPMMLLALLGAGASGVAGGMASKKAGGSFFGGSDRKLDQISQFGPEQQELMEQLWGGMGDAQGSGLDLISQLLSGDEEAFSKFEAPFKRHFNQETIPGIAERFAGMGSGMGSGSSSAFNQSMGQAGKELSESLASLRGGLQQNALSQLQGMMGKAYQPTFTTSVTPPTTGFAGGLAAGLGGGAGNLMGMQFLNMLGNNQVGGSSQGGVGSSFGRGANNASQFGLNF